MINGFLARSVQFALSVILVCLSLQASAQQKPGELSGSIALASNPERTLSVLSIDLLVKGSSDGVVDGAFVVVGPSEGLNEPATEGRVLVAGAIVTQLNRFIEVVLASGKRLLITTPAGEAEVTQRQTVGTRIVRARNILYYSAEVRTDHQGTAKLLLNAPIRWDLTR